MFLFHKVHADSYYITTFRTMSEIKINATMICDFYESDAGSEYLLVRVHRGEMSGFYEGKVIEFKHWLERDRNVSKSLPNNGVYEKCVSIKQLLEKIALDATVYINKQQKMEHEMENYD